MQTVSVRTQGQAPELPSPEHAAVCSERDKTQRAEQHATPFTPGSRAPGRPSNTDPGRPPAPTDLEEAAVLEGVGPGDGVGQARPAHDDAAAVLRGVAHAHAVLREPRQREAVQGSAQHGAQLLEVAVGAAAEDASRRGVQRGKVGLEGNVAGGHAQARAHALKRAAPPVVGAGVVAEEGEVRGVAAAGEAGLYRV